MKYDVCIIGSGAGGAPIAYELSNAGFNVVVLEKGKEYKEEDFTKDEVGVCRREMFTPPLKEEQHVINERVEDGGITRHVGSESGWNFWNGSMVGGSSNLMSGYFHRMKPNDFKLESVYGKIEGANVVDWPISYEDLEPYYEKVERVVGVSGRVTKHKFSEPRSTPNFPHAKLAESGVTKWFDLACGNLGFESIATPRAILPLNALNRNGCSYSNFCGSYGCATGAKGSARAALLQRCKAKIITEAFVYRLESDATKITSAHYYDKEGISHAITAKIFVLAAQAIESSRLLLNSKNRYFKNGIANNSNQVGKNLIFSAGGAGEGRFYHEHLTPQEQKDLMQPGLFFNRSLQDWYEYEEGGKKYKGGTIDFLFEHANIISRARRELYKDGKLIWGEALAKKMYQSLTTSRVLTFEVFNDWLPTDGCFVSVDSEVKDKFHMPVGVINLWGHPHDLKVGEHLAKQAAKVLEKMGAQDISMSISSSPPPNLVAGGCRFGDDPKTSVLDRECRAHELENLYVSDASFMPTGGSVPYTWTIYANAFRVADSILKRIKS
ncbi:MAG: GMC family oxidoreductase [Epsilonproteobacteria bacterium]|nr:GMC family oxidoreductase [Campylobacterota bacterium]OIO13485.1 MAG: oxidoreductase [Helicobacteraceae bacterium CG1_02_36_14]PIP11278.1 MAG: oxidoreductase [Sulfurimonas sp. CG23_combo_of_CG06-09_8_20_14_all_36_33]PIS23922.1 MAG: oxidoreductase [Sulfurimonas sp. CG08_land_8_20_14_0_20_36_33]PIU35292.1 MAG: oxidoreductase [Sulfurimonas sp. CG07_land_8_20_14_0_80_36_56]PIV03955.1 MAG: oxidoreductase [Sulfurimonas sp. CG03_land_8_20_14_0_80_36_25]PIV34281.1 MAG: oxidoreductase [Sulfurimonas